ncbi:SDR family oxidoreductase [Niveibacterium sp. SC-1]|uniref:SDR family NAD(P)-dependent oxidoreductase n=1 Tax=Niveibacterium sp. SC-1 TaxID=3135646 RepID=UPI00311DF03A
MKRLEGKWALVTGSTRGIGRQIALGLATRGCNVIVHGRSIAAAEKTCVEVRALGVQARAIAGELSDAEAVRGIIAQVGRDPGQVDILYNNAAIMNAFKPIYEIGMDEWLQSFQVNLFAMVQLSLAFAPGMKARGFGRIVNLTSGIRDIPQLAPYSVSKAAVDKFSRDLAADLAGSNVLVNYLDPGWLKTDLGGPNAENEVETVLPGALYPALLEDYGPSGRFYAAQDYKHLVA